ncbi:hypothetical protein OsI_31256 [Oryza sativa Indica Group]|uniref:Uncharacterized protein n=1 Tax=Oryza sativa subsp. indica TaxID=39946 RepID=A2Z0Y2_ORYSI|nr:hypothetical protein OsI_31256 [Oryza sativa Indica Group]
MAAAAVLAAGFFHLPLFPLRLRDHRRRRIPSHPPCRDGEGPPAAGRSSHWIRVRARWIRARAHLIRARACRIGRQGAQRRRFLSSLLRDRRWRGVAVAVDLGTGRGDAQGSGSANA